MQSSDNLPNLPRKLHKREADITPKILAWFRKNHKQSCAIEIKASTGDTIPRSALAPHQRAALLAAMGQGITHKLSDEARRRQPFDAFMLAGVEAYVVCAFTKRGIALVMPVHWFDGARYDSPAMFTIPI